MTSFRAWARGMKSNEVFVPRSRHSWSSLESVIVHTMKSKPNWGSISPLKVVKQRPQKVPSHVCSFPVHATTNIFLTERVLLLSNNLFHNILSRQKKLCKFGVYIFQTKMGMWTPYCSCQGIQVSTQVVYSVHIIDHFFSGHVGVLLPPNSYARQYIQNKVLSIISKLENSTKYHMETDKRKNIFWQTFLKYGYFKTLFY